MDPNRPNPKRSGGLAYSTLSGYCVVRQLDLIPPLEPVRDPWDPPRTPPGGPSWIFEILHFWPIYRKPPKVPKSVNPRRMTWILESEFGKGSKSALVIGPGWEHNLTSIPSEF